MFRKLLPAITLLSITQFAYADLHDFGGHDEEFKGDGDKVPPKCQINLPSGATEPFVVKWNCEDDTSPQHEIRTELWIQRNGANHPEKVEDFLGIPSLKSIDEKILKSTTVAAGLPAAFRLVARDRAGAATVSPFFTVEPGEENSLDNCTLELNRAAEESLDEDSTGSPATSLILSETKINVNSNTSNSFSVSTDTAEIADPCDIAAICDETDDGQVSFVASLDGDAGTGSITVSPGNFQASLTGTATSSSVIMTGTGTIDGTETSITLECSKSTTDSTTADLDEVQIETSDTDNFEEIDTPDETEFVE